MRISVCTVTARRGFVEEQARMLARQDHEDLEWVLVDFAFEERVKALRDLSKEIGLQIRHVPNVRSNDLFFRDITRNRNKALAEAGGDAVIFLDDYAIIPDDYVTKHAQILSDNCISAGIMHRYEALLDESFLNNVPTSEVLMEKELGKDFRDRNGQVYSAIGITYTGNLGIPRLIFEHINGFDPRMESGLEDCDLGMRAHMANFTSMFNPVAYTINLNTGGFPYTYKFDHAHDVEPFISNPNNNFRGDAKLEENEYIKVHFYESHRIAECKICGAKGMIDPNELMDYKMKNNEFRVPDLPHSLNNMGA